MSDSPARSTLRSLIARGTDPLIAVPIDADGEECVQYFVDESDADAATTEDVIAAALSTMGAWSDLDWDETAEALNSIRHDRRPAPPNDDR